MVTAYSTASAPSVEEQKSPAPIQYTSVGIDEIVAQNYRMSANFFDIEGREARKILEKGIYPTLSLCGDESAFSTAYYLGRFKRIYVTKSEFPIYQPAQICEFDPKPSAYISSLTQTDINALRVKKRQILLTRSGTVGRCSYAGKTLHNRIFSDDLIRITPKQFSGYVYAFLCSKIGQAIIKTNQYGAVVSHIEPEHLHNLPVPNPPELLQREIHLLIEESFRLRDESNALMNQAQSLLKEALNLPDIEVFAKRAQQFDTSVAVSNYSVPLSNLSNRFDASAHKPIVQEIKQHLQQYADEVTTVGDGCISKSVILPGRFKRVYVAEDVGVVFVGGKQILELDPGNKKYLSLSHHRDRIDMQLRLKENMTLVTCSGTIGKVAIVPTHWNNWTASQHIIRVVPASQDIAGYLYAWMSSPCAQPLITAHTYGAVVDEITDHHIASVPIPLCRDTHTQDKINSFVLKANSMRYKAYLLEQDALRVMNNKVIQA